MFYPLGIEVPVTGPFGEQPYGTASVEVGEGLTHGSEWNEPPLEGYHVDRLQDPVHPAIVAEEILQGEKADLLTEDGADQDRVEERVVVGRDHERWIGEVVVVLDLETPGNASNGPNQGRAASPEQPL